MPKAEILIHHPLDRYTRMSEMADNARLLLQNQLGIIAVVLAACTGLIAYLGHGGTIAFALISLGTIIALAAWRSGGSGVPMLPMMVIQHLFTYGMPILTGHEMLSDYSESLITHAGLEVFVFLCMMVGAWRFGMQLFKPAPPIAYTLNIVTSEGMEGLGRMGFRLVLGATLYQIVMGLGVAIFIFDYLPDGMYSIFVALSAAVTTCGFFLASMAVGSGRLPHWTVSQFWVLLVVNALISASGFLLSDTTILFAAVMIGLFWSSGRIPWRFLIITLVLLSFFNIGKFTMRDRYWRHENLDAIPVSNSILSLPSNYVEWTQASFDLIVNPVEKTQLATFQLQKKGNSDSAQSLTTRVNNLQNLLYVIDAVDEGQVPLLLGATYTLIPPLLVPRIFWADKPRSHEGQVMLNVHFGRQDMNSTLVTYVAWGLLAEAYGNFGTIGGSLFLGCVLGLLFAWVENFTSRKPVFSIEGFLAFALFLGMAASFEMVASVLVTSIFQSMIPIAAAAVPFVHRMTLKRPDPRA